MDDVNATFERDFAAVVLCRIVTFSFSYTGVGRACTNAEAQVEIEASRHRPSSLRFGSESAAAVVWQAPRVDPTLDG